MQFPFLVANTQMFVQSITKMLCRVKWHFFLADSISGASKRRIGGHKAF